MYKYICQEVITTIRALKIRLFPTKEQEELFYKHIGCCRFIWNYMLSEHERIYEEEHRNIYKYDMMRLMTNLKTMTEFYWLNEVSNKSLEIICKDLSLSYDKFFNKISRFPKYKSKKKSKKSFPIRGEKNRFYFTEDFVKIEKIGKVKYKSKHKNIIGKYIKFHNPRISLVHNKWILSVGIDYESQVVELTDKSLGIDLGIKELAVCSFGGDKLVFHNINKTKRMKNLEHKLKHIQRIISRKYRTNKNYDKTKNILKYEEILRDIYYKMSCIRENYIHQTTHYLISLLPHKIVMEDLNASRMMKNKHLSKAISEQCFYKFIEQMRYKCEMYGIEFIQVDRFYPSSKTCSNCGCIKRDLKLSDRIYKCNECGLEIDRDFNAAINLERYVVNQQ